MADSVFGALVENPEYQKSIISLMGMSPAIKALANFSDVDEAFAKDYFSKKLILDKMGTDKSTNLAKLDFKQQDINLDKERLDLQKNLGLGNKQLYLDLRLNQAKADLKSKKRDNLTSNILGGINTGVSAFRTKQDLDTSNTLTKLYLDRRT